MKIYGIDDSVLLDAVITSNAQHEEEMGKSNFVRLSWKTNVRKSIPVGAYIIPYANGLKYRLIEPYEPQQDAEDTFTYQPEFQHPIMWLSKVPFTYATKNTLGEDTVQQEWEFTGATATLLQYVVDFINDAFGFSDKEKFALTLVGSVDTNISVSFSSTDVLSAISSIASACSVNKCEWHLSWEQKALYFGQVSINLEETIPTLKVGDNVGKASISESQNGYYNVFFPQGSTRNMSVRAASGENVSTGIRLGLDKTKYPNGEIDTRTDENEPKQTLALTFDDIYPHVDCYVYNVRQRTRYLLDDENNKVVSEYNSDGSVKAYKTYTVWYMRLAYPLTARISGKTPVATTSENLNGTTQTLYWYDYEVEDSQILDGYTLCGSFKVNTNEDALTSSLVAQPSSGDGFELKYHKTALNIPASESTGDSGVDILKGDFEIVFANENDTIIPTNESEGLIPRGLSTPSVKGNIVILYNIAMGDDEVTAAQDELESETLKEIAYRHSDLKNYTFNSYPNKFAANNPHLYIGQRVVYDDGNGYSYTTRILKLTTNLDYDIVQEITVGNAAIKGTMTQLKEDVHGMLAGTISVGSGLNYSQIVSIVRNYARTRFLSKQYDDVTQGHLSILGGAYVGGNLVANHAYSENYAHEGFPFGKGWKITDDDGSKASMLEIDKLFVRMKAVFAELEIRKLSYVGGNYLFSAAGAKIYYVEWLDSDGNILDKTTDNAESVNTYRCYMYTDDGTTATQNLFKVDDQVRCQNFDIKNGTQTGDGSVTLTNAGNHYWWRRVNAVGEGKITAKGDDTVYQYVDFLNTSTQYGADSDAPEEEDTMVQFGSWTNEERQGAIMIVVEGEMSPAIIEYTEVGKTHFTIPDPYTQICANPNYGNVIRGKFISIAESGTAVSGTIDEQISSLIDQLNDIKNQADKKFEIWFNSGAPHPQSATDTETNAPASDWATDAEKALHAQDLYYDTDKDPASDGGRAWRWTAHDATSTDSDGNETTTTNYFWDEVTDQDTISALEKAADLQNQVDDIVSDCVISAGSEKSQLLIQWNEAIANFKKYTEQAADYNLTDPQTDDYQEFYNAFYMLATYLNNGSPSGTENLYTEEDSSNGTIPEWIGDNFNSDTFLSDYDSSKDVTRAPVSSSVYRAAWSRFHTATATILRVIQSEAEKETDLARSDAETANKEIANITADGILDPAEKISVKKEFLSLWHEIVDDGGLVDKGRDNDDNFYSDDISTACQVMESVFSTLGTYLNDGEAWNVLNIASSTTASEFVEVSEDGLPSWLKDLKTSVSIDATVYRSHWSTYYSARAAYIGMLSKNAQTTAEKAQTTADGKANVFTQADTPTPPYNKGDLWIQTDKNNNVMVCLNSKAEGESYEASDWADLSEIYNQKDPRMLLAELAEKIYDISGGYIAKGSIKVYIFPSHEMAFLSGLYGHIRYNGSTVERQDGDTWTTLDNSGYTDAFAGVYAMLGTQTITVYGSKPTSGMQQYDLVIRKVSWHDPWQDADVEGNIEVLYYNGSNWELIKESSTAIIENLGSEIRTVVFGSDGTGATDSSGLVTKTMFNELFSEKVTIEDGLVTNISKSGLVTTTNFNDWLTDTYGVDKTNFQTLLDAKADVESFASLMTTYADDAGVVKTASLSAYVTKTDNGDGTYSLESDILLTADKITFVGKTVINDKFWVDTDGNVHMADAYVSGQITATSGTIAGFKISGNGLTNDPFTNDAYVIFRNDAHNCFAGIGGNVLPSTSGIRGVARFENEDSSDQWGLGYNVAMYLSAKNAAYNFAFIGSGNGFLNGAIDGFKYNAFTPSDTANGLPVKNGLRIIVNGTYTAVYLPTLATMKSVLCTSGSFCINIQVLAGKGTSFNLYGYRDGNYNDSDCPKFLDRDFNAKTDGWAMGQGDSITLALIYDGTDYYSMILSSVS